MKSRKIPDKWNAVILGTALLSCVTMPEPVPVSRIIGLFCVSVPFLIGALLVPGSFGGGDIKLMAAGGVFLGWKAALASAVIGIFLGGIWAGGCLIMGEIERKACFPLGPFLCLGMAFGVYIGNPLAEYFLIYKSRGCWTVLLLFLLGKEFPVKEERPAALRLMVYYVRLCEMQTYSACTRQADILSRVLRNNAVSLWICFFSAAVFLSSR